MQTFVLFIFLLCQLFIFYKFYQRKDGQKAVYRTWYAGIIDILGILSGLTILTLSIYTLNNKWIFNVFVPDLLFYIFFLIGSWQFCIHLCKILIRLQAHRKT